MPIEQKRGCGYRKVGSLYLIGGGMAVPCDALPLLLIPCETCGFELPFLRSIMMLKSSFIGYLTKEHGLMDREGELKPCTCSSACPICFPENLGEKAGLMWVGNRYYSPQAFIKEAISMGVSKKIATIPKDLLIGKTWIVLAHKKVPFYKEIEGGMRLYDAKPNKPAIFYAFKPTGIEKLIWKSEATAEVIRDLEDRGITPVLVPDGDEDHK